MQVRCHREIVLRRLRESTAGKGNKSAISTVARIGNCFPLATASHGILLPAPPSRSRAPSRTLPASPSNPPRACQCREARSESQRQVESVKRLRLLLAQARALLREQGVPFMEDDPGLDLLLQAEKDKDKGGGLKGRNSLRHGASGNMGRCHGYEFGS